MLNLLCFSRRDPTKSANEEVYGSFDYNKMPVAPLGTKGLVYDGPAVRASWAPHGTDAYYVGNAPKHYHVCSFSCPLHAAFVSPTLGVSTPAIAPRQPSPLMTSPSYWHVTFYARSVALSLPRHAMPSDCAQQSAISAQLCRRPCPPTMQLRGWRLPQMQGCPWLHKMQGCSAPPSATTRPLLC